MDSTRKKVYVAGPYTKGNIAANVRAAILIGDKIADLGLVPFIPHLNHFWHLASPRSYEFWVDYDNQWLPLCDAVFRIPGESHGSDAEEELARELGIPVFHTVKDLVEWSHQ